MPPRSFLRLTSRGWATRTGLPAATDVNGRYHPASVPAAVWLSALPERRIGFWIGFAMLAELCRRLGEEEWKQYDRISSALTFQTTLAAVTASGATFFALGAPVGPISVFTFLYWALLVCGGLAIAFHVTFLILAWYGHVYQVLPDLENLRRGHLMLFEHYRKHGHNEDKARKLADEKFSERLHRFEFDVAQHNRETNRRRFYYRHYSRGGALVSVAVLLVQFIPYIIIASSRSQLATASQPAIVKVQHMSDEPKDSPEPADSDSNQPATPEPPEFDFGPENIIEADLTPERLEERGEQSSD